MASFADAAMPSGIARRQNGALIVANTSTGQVQSFNPDGSTSILAEGLRYPQALALDAAGNIYVVTGTGGQQILRANYMPSLGDTIVRVTPQGEVRTLVSLPRISGLAVSPQNELLALTGWDGGLVRITPDGRTTLILRGLGDVTDLKFDLAGHLYMSDTKLNGIVRIGGFPQGILSGVVTDASGAPVAGARVHVLSDDPIVIGQVLTTDAVGRFSLPAAPRTYSVTVTAEGYASVTLDGIQVDADQETVLEVKLKRQ